MAIGRITGSVLKSNLTRNGVDLAFETNLLYLDVTNSRVGIGTSSPSSLLHIDGTTTTSGFTANGAINIDGTGTSNMDNVIIGANTAAAGSFSSLTLTTDLPVTHGGTGASSLTDNSVLTGAGTSAISAESNLTFDGSTLAVTGAATVSTTLGVTGASTLDGVTISDNTIKTNASNANLELSANGTGSVSISGINYPTSDGLNGQVLQTDGSGAISFADASGGGGGNNTAIRQVDFNFLTTAKVVDQFDIQEFRGAVYHIQLHDVTNTLYGQTTINVVHDGTTAFISQYETNEDSLNLVTFTAAISGTKVQITATPNADSSHINLRMYRIALGDHHETVSNTNSKIIVDTNSIGSSATTIDTFTKTDIRSAKYYILIKNSTNTEFQISELSVTHDGTTAYFNDYGKSSTNSNHYLATFQVDISGSNVLIKAIAGGGTEATATMYRIDLGSKTKLGMYDNVHYGKAGDVDSTTQTIDTYTASVYKSAKYFVSIGNSADAEYQNSEITVVNDGSDAYITESLVRTGTTNLATFTADISGGFVRLRMSGTSSDNEIYFARISLEEPLIYRAHGHSANDVFVSGKNLVLSNTSVDMSGATGALTLPSGTSAQAPSGTGGMLRYNTSTGAYQKFDTTSDAFVDITTTTSTASTDDASVPSPTTSIGTTATVIDQFTTSTADSAFYYAVTRDEINNEVSTARYSVVHDDTAAYAMQSHMVESGDGTNAHLSVDADINSGQVRLLGTGTSVVNSVSLYRIILGDSTSAATSGNITTSVNSDVDSASEVIDSFAHASYRGAKYFISVNSTSQQELSNIEALVVHNGTTAYITTYGESFTGSNSLISLTEAINGSNVELSASGNSPNLRVTMYRILLSDSESASTGDNVNVIAATTVSSTATSIDSFSTGNYTGALYVVTGHNGTEGASSIQEVMVVSDGSDAYVGAGPVVSSKETDQLSFTASLSGTTVSLKASSTSGASTTVNAYRVHLQRGEGGAATSNTVLIDVAQTISGAKTFTADVKLNDDVKLKLGTGGDLEIYHDGSNSYIDDAGTGTIFYRSGTQTFMNAAGSKTMAVFNAASSVDLNFNNSTKFQTTNHGVQLDGVMRMAVESGDPSTVSNSAHIYAKDDSSSAEVFVQDEAGNVTKISPHNEKGEWEYFSRNTITGKTVRVNMEEMIRDIEKLTGKKYIKEE
jgi:hypothetical protein